MFLTSLCYVGREIDLIIVATTWLDVFLLVYALCTCFVTFFPEEEIQQRNLQPV